ncbi:dipeptide ABC transporter ATP-binding protein [Rhizobium binxianense]
MPPENKTAEPPVLSVMNLTTLFGHGPQAIPVVRGVSLEVGRGRILGIVGESGSGKSVTARSVMRLLRSPGWVSEGRVRLNGREILDLSEAEMRNIRGREVAMVFQDPQSTLNPVMRVGDQIVEALTVHGMAKEEARGRAIELLRQVGIPDVERTVDNYPHEFSGGMRQRVVIAIALANKPSLLIADEPTTALDVTIQAQILRLLVELRRDLGVSIIMITHDMGVVAELCDDIAVMYGGRVVESGPVAKILSQPLHPYTAALLKAVPRIDDQTGAELAAIPGAPPLPVRMPKGCPFHPRCSHAIAKCQTDLPPIDELDAGHASACWVALDGKRDLGPPARDHAVRAPAVLAGTPPILSIENLRVDVTRRSGLLGGHTPVFAVDGVSLELFPGETLGLVGESGCGKSSLSRTLVGINRAVEGRITVDGRDVSGMTPEDRAFVANRVQYIFQDPSAALNPRRTIGQSLAEALGVAGITGVKGRVRAEALMDRVGLAPEFLSRFPYEISGGQRQRVGIARALAVEPKILILDEPVSALDVSVQAQIVNLLEELRESLNLALLFIAHDLSVVRHISRRVAVMYLGRIVETGTTQEVYGSPNHPYTAALLSATPDPTPGRQSSQVILTGDMPSPAKPPSGCRFRTRCPIGPLHRPGRDICSSIAPALETKPSGQVAACHFSKETAGVVSG